MTAACARRHIALVTIIFAASLLASRSSAQQPAPVQVSAQPSCADCTIVLTRVARLGAPTDQILIGGEFAPVADHHGHYYALGPQGSPIVVYDSAGRYLTSFARAGQGPGELSSRYPNLAIGPGDSLFTFAAGVMQVFSPEHRWVRTAHLDLPASPRTFLSNGNMVNAGYPSLNATGASFPAQVLSPTGTLLVSFGAPERLDPSCAWCHLFAMTLGARGDRIWLATPQRYELAQWDASGKMLQRVAMTNSAWFRSFDPSNASVEKAEGRFTRVLEMSEDASGLLWIHGVIPPNPSRAEPSPGSADVLVPLNDAPPTSSVTTVLDVYDPARKQMIVSQQFPKRDLRLIGPELFAERGDTSDGYTFWDVWRAAVKRSP
jgi:hypothetical protein